MKTNTNREPESLGIIDWSRLQDHFRNYRLLHDDDRIIAKGTSIGGRYAQATVSAPLHQWHALCRKADYK